MKKITKVVGLEGFCNSGKSHVLKELCKSMLAHQGCRVLQVYQSNGDVDTEKSKINYDDDICVLLDFRGKTVLIVSNGDYSWQPRAITNIILKISVGVDVVFVAMRFKYPAIGEEYRKTFGEYGIQVKSIFKPGCKRVDYFPEGTLAWIDSLWVQKLLAEL